MSPKVLFVYPPNQLMDIETPRPDGSLGPLYLAGALEDAGFQTDILDASVGTPTDCLEDTFLRPVRQSNGLVRIGMTVERMSEVIAQGGYNIVGINSNFTCQTRMAIEVAQAAKAVSRDILVVAGGVNARAIPERFLKSGLVDAVCLTEGERIAVNITRAFLQRQDLSEVSGIVRLRDGKVIRQPVMPSDVCTNLDTLPMPAWHKRPFEHYDRIASPSDVVRPTAGRYSPIMTSRGCWAGCWMCHIAGEKDNPEETGNIGPMRFKSVPRVLQEIETLRALNVRQLYFEDDSLLARRERACTIFRGMLGLGLEAADINGVNLPHLMKREGARIVPDIKFLELFYQAGFRKLTCPVETAVERIMKKYLTSKLNHKTCDVVALVRVATEVGIRCSVNIMIGWPDETEAEMLESVELGRRLVHEAGAVYCTIFVVIPNPGSRLYVHAVQNGHLDPDFDPDILNWKNVVMKNTVVPSARILELRDWADEYVNTKEHVHARREASAGTAVRSAQ